MQSLAIKRSREEEKGDEASEDDELTLRRKVCAHQVSFGLIPIPSLLTCNSES